MNDKEGSGNVSLEGAMQILYLRYGRGLLDAQLEEIFGTSDLNSGKLLQPGLALKLTVNKSLGKRAQWLRHHSKHIQYPCNLWCREDIDSHGVPAKSTLESDQAATEQSNSQDIQAASPAHQKECSCLGLQRPECSMWHLLPPLWATGCAAIVAGQPCSMLVLVSLCGIRLRNQGSGPSFEEIFVMQHANHLRSACKCL